MAKDLRLQALELGAGLDPELVDEPSACILVDLERLRLPAGAIQREHQLSPECLAERMIPDECLELADDVAVAAELEVGIDPLPVGDQAKLVEPADLGLCEIVERELRERRPAPERERSLEAIAPLLGVGAAAHLRGRSRTGARRSDRARR